MKKHKIIYSKEAVEFLANLPISARKKIVFNIEKVATGLIDSTIFKKMENSDIWEFRTHYNGIAYRLFAFWDTDMESLIIAANGFVKKTQKTPAKELNKAEAIRKRYFAQKTKS